MTSLPSRVALGASVAAALMLRGPVTVEAQPAPEAPATDAQKRETAKKLVSEANAALDAKDYDRAIELNQKAYALTSHPLLLFNIGQAHRLAGRSQPAIQFYERYLQLDPGGAEAATAREHLGRLKAEPGPAETAAPPAPPPPIVTEAPPAGGPAPEGPHRTDTVSTPGRSLRITGLVLGGAGLASLAVGGYFGLKVLGYEQDAKDEVQRAMDAGEPPPTKESLQEQFGEHGDAAERNQFIAYAIGGALVVGGAVTYWIGHRKDRAAGTTAWTPVVRPGFAGLAFTGSLP